MKLRDLIVEARIFQNNFIRVGMVEEEFNRIFSDSQVKPKIDFDTNGMFVVLNNFQFADFENMKSNDQFVLVDNGVDNEIKNTRKFYIEFIKAEETPGTEESGSETDPNLTSPPAETPKPGA